MARKLEDRLASDGRPKRILALDGGGVKGLLSLGMAKALEDELRRRSGDPALVLADYYDLIGGTSTGAIVASGLALGLPVDAMIELYRSLGRRVFGKRRGDGLFSLLYDPRDLRAALEPTLGRRTLGSPDLRTGLAIHTKRIDTGSAWVLTNNPAAPYYDADPDGDIIPNRKFRLIDLVMASAAAPTFFDEVVIPIARDDNDKPTQKGYFVDGAVGANNNPAMQLFMLATVPAYGFRWPAGAERLMMTSIGTGLRRPTIAGPKFERMLPGQRGIHALRSMIYDTQIQGVMMMQALSAPAKPWWINGEVKDMADPTPGRPLLLDYQRIDVMLDLKRRKARGQKQADPSQVEALLGETLSARDHVGLDSLANGSPRNMRLLLDLGLAAGKTFVSAAYPDPRFNPDGWTA